MTAIVGAIAKAVLPVVLKRAIEKATDRDTADKIERVIAEDPVVVNELSAERPYQSRVAVGSVVAALGVVIPTVAKLLGYEVEGDSIVEFINAAVVLWGACYALYGRFRSGLKPLFAGRG